jgi:hypothetical protein
MKRIALAGLLAASFGLGLHGQTMNLRASIPFDFQVGNSTLPAGEYLIQNQDGVLIVKGMGSRPVSVISHSHATTRPNAPGQGEVVFNRYGDTYFLTRVWTPESNDGREVVKSPREKELAARGGFAQSATVAAQRK